MSNVVHISNIMNTINSIKNENEMDTSSVSSTTSDLDQDQEQRDKTCLEKSQYLHQPQSFQVKYEGTYVDFIPYKSSYSLSLIPIAISKYEQIPDKVFGKIEIKDYKTNTNTVIYRSFKKKYIKIKNASN